MDWSLLLCSARDSFRTVPPAFPLNRYTFWYRAPANEGLPTVYYVPVLSKLVRSSVHVNSKLLATRNKMREEFLSPRNIWRTKRAVDFLTLSSKVGNSYFKDFIGVEFASVDAISSITGTEFPFGRRNSEKSFSYLVLQDDSNSIVQYLQYRYPRSVGDLVAVRQLPPEVEKSLPEAEFTPKKGEYEETLPPISAQPMYANKWLQGLEQPSRVVVNGRYLLPASKSLNFLEEWANGVATTPGKRYTFFCAEYNLAETTENNYQSIFISVLCYALLVLAPGGNMAVKCFVPLTTASVEIIYLMSLCFEEIALLPPCNTTPSNSCYLLGRNYAASAQCAEIRQSLLSLLSTLLASVLLHPLYQKVRTDNTYHLPNILLGDYFAYLRNSVPAAYSAWIGKRCEELLAREIAAYRRVQDAILGRETHEEYDYTKFLTIWNLPGTPTERTDEEE